MGNLTTSLLNAGSAMQVYSQAFSTIGNNIANASTPGYADQTTPMVALPFDPASGVSGGVMAGPLQTARSEYLELNVRNQQQGLGYAQQTVQDLSQVQPLFDVTGNTGVSGSMDALLNSFSQLSVNPNDPVARQSVIAAAGQAVQAFHQNAVGIQRVAGNVATQTSAAVGTINQLAGQIAALNTEYQSDPAALTDGGLDAQIHTALESLSQVANFSVVRDKDGAFNVYLGGQTPLVLGQTQFAVQNDFSSGKTAILDSQGNDITAQITQGSLGALLQEGNTTLPGYLSQLNTLAQTFADQVNQGLANGVDQNGAPGTNLFTYDQAGDAASTLAVSSITPDQIAAATAAAPGGNGNAIAISQLATQPLVNGFAFDQAYGNLGGQVGTDLDNGTQSQTQYQDTLTQAQQLRSTQTGVNLNAEAAKLLQYQQAYQAVGSLFTVLHGLTQTIIDMIPPGSA